MTLYESYKLSNYSGTYAEWLDKMEDECIALDHSLEYDPEDCCPSTGKPHLYIETYCDERKQILTCKVCGFHSVGWYEQRE